MTDGWTDRQTDRRTDTFAVAKTALHIFSAVMPPEKIRGVMGEDYLCGAALVYLLIVVLSL